MPKYADFMYNLGLLDESESSYFKDQTMKATEFIKQKQYFEAFKVGFVAVFCCCCFVCFLLLLLLFFGGLYHFGYLFQSSNVCVMCVCVFPTAGGKP